MHCPFCAEEINEQAIFCRFCQHDISIPKPLLEQNRELIAKIEGLDAEIERLKTEINRFHDMQIGAQDAGQAAEKTSPKLRAAARTSHIASDIAIVVAILIFAHYVMLVGFDADQLTVNLVCVTLAFVSGYKCFWKAPLGLGLSFGVGGIVGMTAVAGMSLVVWLQYGGPILPPDTRVWQDTITFIVSISLATVAGNICAGFIDRTLFQTHDSESGFFKVGKIIASHISPRESGKTVTDRAKSITTTLQAISAVVAAAAAVYASIKSVLH